MHIAVTGATGYLGACLALGFLRRGFRVTCLSRRDPDGERTRSAVDAAREGFGIEDREVMSELAMVPWEVGSSQKGTGLDAAEARGPIDAVWHCAAHMSLSTSQLAFAHDVNVRGTLALHRSLSELRGGDARFFHVSTAYVGGFAPGTIHEELLTAPKLESSYLVTKWGAELALAQAARAAGVAPVSIVRPTLVGAHTKTDWYGGKPFGIHMYIAALLLTRRLGMSEVRLDLPAEASHNYLPIDDFVSNSVALTQTEVDVPVFVVNDAGTDVTTRAVVEPLEKILEMRVRYGAPQTMADRVLDALTRIGKPIAGTGNFSFASDRLREVLGDSYQRTEVTPELLGRFVERYLVDAEASVVGAAGAGGAMRYASKMGDVARMLDGVPVSMLPEPMRGELADRFVRRVLKPKKPRRN